MNFSKFIVLLCLALLGYSLPAQSIVWGNGTANALETYNGTDLTCFEFTNNGPALSNASVVVSLGVGVAYEAGSLSYTASGAATLLETSSDGDNTARFTIGALDNGEQIQFFFSRRAVCAARDHKSNGGTFSDICQVFEGADELTYSNNNGEAYVNVYDVLSANIVLGAIVHSPSFFAAVGETVTRSVPIVNGSLGAVQGFWYEESYPATDLLLENFSIDGTPILPANVSNSAGEILINFEMSQIQEIGDKDALFEQDESFLLSYDVTVLACGSGTLTSDMNAYYGADVDTECTPSGSATTNITIKNGTPDLQTSIVQNPDVDLCGPTTHVVSITNNGNDPEDFAKDVAVFFGLRANSSPVSSLSDVHLWGSSRIGTRNFSNYTINGNPFLLPQITGTYSSMVDYLPPNSLTDDPDGPEGLEDLDGDGFFDDLAPGETFIVGFDMELTPRDPSCGTGEYRYLAWEHISVDVAWSNQCGDVQVPTRQEIDYSNFIRDNGLTFIESPTDVFDGDRFDLRVRPRVYYNASCAGESGLAGSEVTWTVKCVLPPGVSLQDSAIVDEHNLAYNPNVFQSNDTVYYIMDRYNYDWYTFPLKMDCSEWAGANPLSFNFITNYKCGDCWEEDMKCFTINTAVHCPSACTGVTTTSFEARRTTPGWTNNTQDEFVSLTKGIHAIDKILPFDSLQMTAKGRMVDTLSDNLQLRITYSPESGDDIFDYVEGNVTLYDLDAAYGNTAFTFPLAGPQMLNPSTGNYEWLFDLSSYLDLIDPAYQIGEGIEADSFQVDLRAVFNQNTGRAYRKVENFRANFFMMGDTSEISCDSYGANLYYTGFEIGNSGNTITLEGCGQERSRLYSAFFNSAGNVFPNEYRPIIRFDSLIWNIPADIYLTGDDLPSSVYTVLSDAGDQVTVYPSSNYTAPQWGTNTYPSIYLGLKASCALDPGLHNSSYTMYNTIYGYHPDPTFHQDTILTHATLPAINFIKPNLTLAPLLQTQPGLTDTVTWDLQFCNGTLGIDLDSTWIAIDQSLSNGIQVLSAADVTEAETNLPITDFGGGNYMVRTAGVIGGACKIIRISATYDACAPDEILVSQGWDCFAYPDSLAELASCSGSTALRVEPQAAQVATTVSPLSVTPADPSNPSAASFGNTSVDMCMPFPVEITIVSADASTLFDLNFDLLIPDIGDGLEYIANSATIEVEGIDLPDTPRSIDGAGEASFVAAAGAVWNLALTELDSTNFGEGKGLSGVAVNSGSNQITLRWLMQTTCDMVSGDRLAVRSFALSPCGAIAVGSGEKALSTKLDINGLSPYTVDFSSSFSPTLFSTCNDSVLLDVLVEIIGGSTGANDTLFVALPENLSYSNQYNCSTTACPTFLGTTLVDGRETLAFSYPEGLADVSIPMQIGLVAGPDSGCSASNIDIRSEARISGVNCGMQVCGAARAIMGTDFATAVLEKPIYSISFSDLSYNPDNDKFRYEIEVVNTGAAATSAIEVELYCANATSDSIEQSLGLLTSLSGPTLLNGESFTFEGFLRDTPCNYAHGLAASIRPVAENGAANCSCAAGDLLAVSQAALPVELTSFEVNVSECEISLAWESESEIGFSHYDLQRSFDGVSFIRLASLKGEGSETRAAQYNYMDGFKATVGKVYYRLRMVDLDGTLTYSSIKVADTEHCASRSLGIFPTPASIGSEVVVVYGANLEAGSQLLLTDVLGREVLRLSPNENEVQLDLDTQSLSAGIYWLTLKDERGELLKTGKLLVE